MKVISLFDYTGAMLRPWADAGYDCYAYDWQHPDVPYTKNGITFVKADLTKPIDPGANVAFISAFVPCDNMAVSGARWFKGKGLRALSTSIGLFASAVETISFTSAPFLIENPVSTISTYWRKPDYTFNPYDYTGFCPDDNYTKKTCLWVGNGFVMPMPCRDLTLGDPDDRIHKAAPGPERANFRSATPRGFAKAVFEANKQREKAA